MNAGGKLALAGPRIGEVISNLKSLLSPWSETPSLDAQVLLADICSRNRAWILAHPEAQLTPAQQDALQTAESRLEAGVPLPYILGHWAFFGLDFSIDPQVLIPRPETELMVEQALDWLKVHPQRRLAVDAGTGSGCIAVSLAVHTPDLQVIATDISPTAIAVARINVERHHVASRVDLVQTDLLPANLTRCNLICANLPYIPTRALEDLAVFGREPTLALDGGTDGLGLIRRLLLLAAKKLSPGGLLLFEIEAAQGKTALNLAQVFFPKARIDLLSDFAGRDRLIRIETFVE
jgi:release factor glutamine methyltransferase